MPKTKQFGKLFRSVKRQYLGRPVPKQYQKRYGKVYGKKDVTGFSYAIAKSRGIRIDRRK